MVKKLQKTKAPEAGNLPAHRPSLGLELRGLVGRTQHAKALELADGFLHGLGLRAHADRSPRTWATAQGLATLPLAVAWPLKLAMPASVAQAAVLGVSSTTTGCAKASTWRCSVSAPACRCRRCASCRTILTSP